MTGILKACNLFVPLNLISSFQNCNTPHETIPLIWSDLLESKYVIMCVHTIYYSIPCLSCADTILTLILAQVPREEVIVKVGT